MLISPNPTKESQCSIDLVVPKPEGEEEVDIDLNDPEVEKAAIKIQGSFRQHLSRQNIAKTDSKAEQETSQTDSPGTSGEAGGAPAGEQGTSSAGGGKPEEEEEVDIDLEDPEVAAAAVKIQAGFKRHKKSKK